jgi:hypothetical protein
LQPFADTSNVFISNDSRAGNKTGNIQLKAGLLLLKEIAERSIITVEMDIHLGIFFSVAFFIFIFICVCVLKNTGSICFVFFIFI